MPTKARLCLHLLNQSVSGGSNMLVSLGGFKTRLGFRDLNVMPRNGEYM